MTKTYDPQKVLITYRGALLTGFADGTFVNVSRAADAFTLTVGADGESARAKSADKSGTVRITLLQTSQSNDVLSAFAAQDEATGLGTGPLMVKDAFGTTLVMAAQAWIQKLPDVEFGKETGSREWAFQAGELAVALGGNV